MDNLTLFCIVCRAPIPEDRASRGANTCENECKKKLKAWRRAQVDARRCHHCHKPSTPDDRVAYRAFIRQHPEYKAPRRGRPKKPTGPVAYVCCVFAMASCGETHNPDCPHNGSARPSGE